MRKKGEQTLIFTGKRIERQGGEEFEVFSFKFSECGMRVFLLKTEY
jgi:hypothetical protein